MSHTHYFSTWWLWGFMGGFFLLLIGLHGRTVTQGFALLAAFIALYFVAVEVWA